MRTTRLSIATTSICIGLCVHAQDIPTDVIGDTGWMIYNSDTLFLVRAADGNVWMQHNMGSAQVATAFNDAAAFGDRYQWGRWHDLHSLPSSARAAASTLSPNNPLGLGLGSDKFYIGPDPTGWWGTGSGTDTWNTTATATSGIDPCASLGPGWFLPTQAQWLAVTTSEAITNTATAFDSNLKLTAAGARDGQVGTVINAGLYGQYWSSTASGPYAKDLTVGDTWVNADDDALRSYGMCVRCLNAALHVGMPDRTNTEVLNVFPNPSTGTITVRYGSRMIKALSVHSSDMRLVGTYRFGDTAANLSLEALPAGLYWIKAETTDGILWDKVVLER